MDAVYFNCVSECKAQLDFYPFLSYSFINDTFQVFVKDTVIEIKALRNGFEFETKTYESVLEILMLNNDFKIIHHQQVIEKLLGNVS
jgi:hypothetical protein